MNIIQRQTQIIEDLKKEIAALQFEKENMQLDIKKTATSLKKVWDSMGLDQNILKSKNKLMMATSVLTKISKKEVQSTITTEWEEASAILDKYKHLIDENGN